MDQVVFKPLTVVKTVIEKLGFSISYLYDDLIFVDTNAMVVCYTDQANCYNVYYNADLEKDARVDIEQRLSGLGSEVKLKFDHKGSFEMQEADEPGEVTLRFIDQATE